MNGEEAKQIAIFLGGEAWQTGGRIWVVLLKRTDGRLVVIDEDAVTEYEDFAAFDEGQPSAEIALR